MEHRGRKMSMMIPCRSHRPNSPRFLRISVPERLKSFFRLRSHKLSLNPLGPSLNQQREGSLFAFPVLVVASPGCLTPRSCERGKWDNVSGHSHMRKKCNETYLVPHIRLATPRNCDQRFMYSCIASSPNPKKTKNVKE